MSANKATLAKIQAFCRTIGVSFNKAPAHVSRRNGEKTWDIRGLHNEGYVYEEDFAMMGAEGRDLHNQLLSLNVSGEIQGNISDRSMIEWEQAICACLTRGTGDRLVTVNLEVNQVLELAAEAKQLRDAWAAKVEARLNAEAAQKAQKQAVRCDEREAGHRVALAEDAALATDEAKLDWYNTKCAEQRTICSNEYRRAFLLTVNDVDLLDMVKDLKYLKHLGEHGAGMRLASVEYSRRKQAKGQPNPATFVGTVPDAIAYLTKDWSI